MSVGVVGALLVIGLTILVAGALAYLSLVEVCGPNEVLVFSGAGGNYEVIHSGRKMKIPLFHKVDRLDVTNMTIELQVENAYSKGGIPLRMRGMANVKIGSQSPFINNAIERFLTTPKKGIRRICRETLEGNLRGVLAGLTPEQVNYDREEFETNITTEAVKDLKTIGVVLDTLKIQHIEDDHGYLEALGRKAEAEQKKKARIEEAQNRAETMVKEAENRLEAELADIESKRKIADADAKRNVMDAESKGKQLAAEAKSDIGAKIAKAEANLEVEKARVEQTKEQVEADIKEPAKAEMEELQAQAKAKAAELVEDGKADVEAMRELLETWEQAGDAARPLLLTQKFDDIVSAMLSTIDNIEIEKITAIDSEVEEVDRSGTTPLKTASGVEQINEMLGVDIADVVKGLSADSGVDVIPDEKAQAE